jgi:AmiR/NasT family two-component response regulator
MAALRECRIKGMTASGTDIAAFMEAGIYGHLIHPCQENVLLPIVFYSGSQGMTVRALTGNARKFYKNDLLNRDFRSDEPLKNALWI